MSHSWPSRRCCYAKNPSTAPPSPNSLVSRLESIEPDGKTGQRSIVAGPDEVRRAGTENRPLLAAPSRREMRFTSLPHPSSLPLFVMRELRGVHSASDIHFTPYVHHTCSWHLSRTSSIRKPILPRAFVQVLESPRSESIDTLLPARNIILQHAAQKQLVIR